MTHTPGPEDTDLDPHYADYQAEMIADDRVRRAAPDLLAALKAVCGTIISSGSGPAAPTFDEFDAQVERKRRHWYTIDAAAVDAARAAIEKAEGK